MNYIARFTKAVRTHGVAGTMQLAGGMIARPLLKPLQRWWAFRYLRVTGHRFDREYQVDTSGWVDGEQLDGGANIRHATAYSGVAPAPFHMVMDQLNIDFEKHIFVDFGSGKGRALFLAAQYPFARMIGVEFSPRLHEAAQANCRTFRDPATIGSRIELRCMDATKFDIPDQPAVLFFFNPFSEAIMRPIAEKINASLMENPRSLVVIYFWPTASKAWDGLNRLLPRPINQPTWAWPAHRGRTIVSLWVSQNFETR